MLAQEVIRHKRDKQSLTKEEIDFFVNGIVDWSVSESQIASFVMAVCLRGLDNDELVNLTKSIACSGNPIEWHDRKLNGPIVDRLSTRGIGDKTSLILGPLLAACGAFVPMISSKRLDPAGSVLDKIDSIRGYNTTPSLDEFFNTMEQAGCAIIYQPSDQSPATKRILTVQESLGNLDYIPFIAVSMLARKIAAGAEYFILDIKYGKASVLPTIKEAKCLADVFMMISSILEKPIKITLTNADHIIGDNVGNTLEVLEAIEFLNNKHQNPDLKEYVQTLAIQALTLTGLAKTNEEALEKINIALNSGKAFEHFVKMVTCLGVANGFETNYEDTLSKAPIIEPVYAKEIGFIHETNTTEIGEGLNLLGGQKKEREQTIDYAVGFEKILKIGDKVDENTPLAIIHARTQETFEKAKEILQNAIKIKDTPVNKTGLVYETMTTQI